MTAQTEFVKTNIFIRSIDFEPDGSVFLTLVEEYELLKNGTEIIKLLHDKTRVPLSFDDENTENVLGIFAPVLRNYWQILKDNVG